MISSKSLIKLVQKWQNINTMSPKWILLRGGIRFADTGDGDRKSSALKRGNFVFYTIDGIRFVLPIAVMDNNIFLNLFKMSEEEFGITHGGPIIMPFDSTLMSCIVLLVQRGMAKDSENALLSVIASS